MRSSKSKPDNQALIAILSAAILGVSVVIFFVLGQQDKDKEPAKAELVAAQAIALPAGGAMPSIADMGRAESEEQEFDDADDEAPELEVADEVDVVDDAPAPKVKEKEKVAKPSRTRSQSSSRSRAEKSVAVTAPVIAPVPEAPKAKPVSTLTITSVPRGATIALDGIFIGKAPITKIVIAPGRHTVAASFVGYEPKLAKFNTAVGELETVSLSMNKIVQAVAAPAVATVAPAKVERAAATPRVASAKEGDAGRGRSTLNGTCNSCHAKEGVSKVSTKRYTRSQWDRFFASGRHDRYQRLGGKVSSTQLANVKAYLKSKAADAARNQGAGIR